MAEELVLDASSAIDSIRRTDPAAEAMRRRIGAAVLHTSSIFPFEVANGLRRHFRDSSQYVGGLDLIDQLQVQHWEWPVLRRRIVELRHDLTAYDASYVAIAELADATLLTRDARLAAAPGVRCRVEVW